MVWGWRALCVRCTCLPPELVEDPVCCSFSNSSLFLDTSSNSSNVLWATSGNLTISDFSKQSQLKISDRIKMLLCGVALLYWLVLPEPASPSSPEWTWMKSSAWSWRKKLNIDTSAHLLQLKHLYLKPEGKNNQENSLSLEIWCCFLILLLLQAQRLLKHHHPLFLVRFGVTDKICSYCVGFKLPGGHPDTFTETEPHGQQSDGGSGQT